MTTERIRKGAEQFWAAKFCLFTRRDNNQHTDEWDTHVSVDVWDTQILETAHKQQIFNSEVKKLLSECLPNSQAGRSGSFWRELQVSAYTGTLHNRNRNVVIIRYTIQAWQMWKCGYQMHAFTELWNTDGRTAVVLQEINRGEEFLS